ncbi:PH domain-containing protein [Oceanobacillus sp. 1P07AA]|uniref:PH domain-containing protein n=1 Tax=Oceanobacillus sp. 1P07AA TaxID=3132293 RepID=UPI0039A66D5D
MYFRSKKDKWLTIILWVVVLLGVIAPLLNGQWFASGLMIIIGLFLLWFWFRTGYRIDNDKILIYYGPVKQTVKIKDIEVIFKTKFPLTSPALSFDRMQIKSGKYDIVTISPEEKESFLQQLMDINPDISIDKRLLESTERK